MREILLYLLLGIFLAGSSPLVEAVNTLPAEPLVEVKVNALTRAQGELLTVQVNGGTQAPLGSFTGVPLNFQPNHDGWIAFVGISYAIEPGTYPLVVELAKGRVINQSVQVQSGKFKESHVTVSESQAKIVNPKPEDKAIVERKARDAERIKQAYSQSNLAPLWTGAFIRSAEGRITTEYGYARVVNGVPNSRHSGTDIANVVGTPILATNDGVVRLAEDLLATGYTIIIDHGAGVFSSYSHLSKLAVKAGDKVTKGQNIGKMGSTGVSTGSHLHWVIRVGDAYLNPMLFVGTDLFQDVKVGLQ